MNGYRDRLGWYVGISAYWFATSFKWFALLFVILTNQVRTHAPEDLANTYWGIVVLIGAVWATIGPAIFGFLSDRSRSRHGKRRPFIAIGAGMTVLALVVLASAIGDPNSPPPTTVNWFGIGTMIVGYLLLQISDDIGTGPYSAIIPQVVPENRRGFASGVMGFARLVAQLAAGVSIFVLKDWLAIYAVIAILNILCAAIVIRTIGPEPTETEAEAPTGGFFHGWLRPWSSVDFRWVFFSSLLLALGFYLVQFYMNNYLRDMVRDFGPIGSIDKARSGEEVSNLAMMATALIGLSISLFGAMGAVVAARLADRKGRKFVIYTSGLIMVLTLVPFLLTRNYETILLLTTLFGIGYGARMSAEWAMVSDVLPDKEEAGKDMGIWQMSQSSVQVFSGGMGALIDNLNKNEMGQGYMTSFSTAAVLFVISTVLVYFIKGTK